MAHRDRPQLTPRQPDRLTVGLLQTAPRHGRIEHNIAELIAARHEVGDVDVALSAELSLTGYGFSPHHPEWLLQAGDPRLADVPPATGIGYAEPAPGFPRNAYAITGSGLPVQHKVHPVSYAPWNEHLVFTAGERVHVGDLAGVCVATLICNDMWHPVMPWYAVHAGAEVLVAPVASLDGGDVQRTWQTILEHTARLLQCYVVFVNRCGTDDGETFWGGSRVLGPDGDPVAQVGRDPATATAVLDIARLRRLRSDIPILRESRPALVAEMLADLPTPDQPPTHLPGAPLTDA